MTGDLVVILTHFAWLLLNVKKSIGLFFYIQKNSRINDAHNVQKQSGHLQYDCFFTLCVSFIWPFFEYKNRAIFNMTIFWRFVRLFLTVNQVVFNRTVFDGKPSLWKWHLRFVSKTKRRFWILKASHILIWRFLKEGLLGVRLKIILSVLRLPTGTARTVFLSFVLKLKEEPQALLLRTKIIDISSCFDISYCNYSYCTDISYCTSSYHTDISYWSRS